MPSCAMARCRPTYARWLNPWSLSPPMSVTTPTFNFVPLLDPLLAAGLVGVDVVGAAPPPDVVVVVLLLLLLPHAASPRARAAVARATRPTGLILPVTPISFPTGLKGQP